ncbi:MAG: hypothetical protein Fur0044_13090 [Anaerolineae bacterium]|nr:hypothetical protein [Anaerolineales bacterium]MCQ3975462.1 hypothetical protein [Anaerolineae bacterium]
MTASISSEVKVVEKASAKAEVAVGVASAAFVASGIGCLVIGLMVTGAEMSEGLKNALNWWNPAGPLTGKTGVGVIVWLVSWVILHSMWKDKDVAFAKAFTVTLILIALGFLLTFPPIFTLFAAE